MNKEDYIFGTRAVIEAIKSGKPIDRVLLKKGLNNELFQELFHAIKESKTPFQFVPVEKINRVTRKNHQGVIGLMSPIEFQDIENVLPLIYDKGKDPLILILDQVSDVRNFGAIARSAECAGVDALLIPEKGFARLNADAVKTSAGALYNIPVCRSQNLAGTIQLLKDSGIKIIAATEKTETLYYQTDMDTPLAIIAGSEDKGISSSLLKVADQLIKIPVLGQIESLNVSVACSLIIYEAVRQRGLKV
ncbi:23S rRNA (guanosine(2251)-2'-O)-methyltransferase [hydrothermal vent metagenome]|uniref:23S rRNA (Guanosine(2251)-2'-O)-methyltransferase n=1 Tax=hydrothermal vent metagenome TaxID=652676 RepID=A0A3B0TAE7_9ZZZZ